MVALAAGFAAAALPAVPLGAQSTAPMTGAIRLFTLGRYAETKAQFRTMATDDPRNSSAAFYLGRAELADGDGEAAATWLERATRLEPRNSRYFYWLGNAYARQAVRANRFRQARLSGRIRGAYQHAVALDPDNLDARSNLLQYYVIAPGIMGGSIDKARDQAHEIAKRSVLRGRLANGVLAERQKNVAVAEQEYATVIEMAPDSAIGYTVLGDLYRRTGQYEKAFTTFERMRRALPNEASALYLFGRTSAVSGQRLEDGEQALKSYVSALRKDTDPPLASAHFRLGAIYEKLGRRDLARQEYETTLHLDRAQDEARDALKRVR